MCYVCDYYSVFHLSKRIELSVFLLISSRIFKNFAPTEPV